MLTHTTQRAILLATLKDVKRRRTLWERLEASVHRHPAIWVVGFFLATALVEGWGR